MFAESNVGCIRILLTEPTPLAEEKANNNDPLFRDFGDVGIENDAAAMTLYRDSAKPPATAEHRRGRVCQCRNYFGTALYRLP
ncbi:hypothetical protein N7456_011256 [Penicillium angulare]|uniref:Uncharacterized protein n=1 Tax=Penicillium angulare TaxID=116970 RepID=A0A9W9ETN6_9EURO|nr:hypothetical protein N7456_011256 [Penicillium angulare]